MSRLNRRVSKLEGYQGSGGPVWPDIIFLVSLMPDGQEHSREAEDGPYVAFVKGGPFHGLESNEDESLEEFRQRLMVEYPHLQDTGEASCNQNAPTSQKITRKKND